MGDKKNRPGFWARHERAVQVVAAAAVLWGIVYITWRIGWTWRGANPFTYGVLLAAELFAWVSITLYTVMGWRVGLAVRPQRGQEHAVDVYVCTYDEPKAVLHATLAGCRAIRYPHTTWLLDDGRRPEMEQLAHEMGARYLTRPDNKNAKAGNINHALPKTHGDLVLMLDADHVPMPDILDATLGYFDESDVVLVQTPHDFYNRDSVQHTKSARHEQSLFYTVIAPGKDRYNSMFWCGSATILRREALLDVGGVLTDTVAEDFHTTIAMHARGGRTRYHNETLVQGLAPHDLAGFLLQRDRWARGNLRVFRTKQNPITCRGLSLGQRVSYFGSLFNYFSGIQRLLMLAVLATTLVSGQLPLTTSPLSLVAFWLPWVVLSVTATLALARGTLGAPDSTQYGMMTMEIFTRALASLVRVGSGGFKVTPKEGIDEGGWRVLAALPILTTVGGVLAVAITLRAATALFGGPLPELAGLALVLTLAVGLWELGWVSRVLGRLARRKQLRTQYRFSVDLAGLVGANVVRVVDLSPTGFALESSEHFMPGSVVSLALRLPDPHGVSHDVELRGKVQTARPISPDVSRVGCRLLPTDAAAYDALIDYCYVVQAMHILRGEFEPEADVVPATGRAATQSAAQSAVS